MSQLQTNSAIINVLNEELLPSLIEKINALPEASGGTNIETTGSDFLVQSTAEGSVIYSINTLNGISIMQANLSYFSSMKKYRVFVSSEMILNTPIIILSSGTITCGAPMEHTSTKIASGTGYAVYKITASDGSEDP